MVAALVHWFFALVQVSFLFVPIVQRELLFRELCEADLDADVLVFFDDSFHRTRGVEVVYPNAEGFTGRAVGTCGSVEHLADAPIPCAKGFIKFLWSGSAQLPSQRHSSELALEVGTVLQFIMDQLLVVTHLELYNRSVEGNDVNSHNRMRRNRGLDIGSTPKGSCLQ